MTKQTYQISGRVIDRETKRGVAGLQIKAWDKDPLLNDLIGSDVTDSQGAFHMTFDPSYFQEFLLDRRPDLFFEIFDGDGDKPIHSTEGSVRWNVDVGEIEVVIEIERPVDEEPDPTEPGPDQGQPQIKDTALMTGLQRWRSMLEKEEVRSAIDLRRLARRPDKLNELGFDEHDANTLITFAALARVFPADVAIALQEAKVTDIPALKDWSEAQFEDALRDIGIERRTIAVEKARFARLQALLNDGLKAGSVNGIILDLGNEPLLSDEDQETLTQAGVETLIDWTAQRRQVKLSSAETAHRLDDYARLGTVGASGNLAVGLLKANIDGAYGLTQLSHIQIARFSQQLKEPGASIYIAVQQAQQKMTLINELLLATQTAGNSSAPSWIAENQVVGIIGITNLCVPCADAASIFSCFAYIVDLIQLTGKTVSELNDALGIDLGELSAMSVLEPASGPEPDCEETTICDRVVRLLHGHLDQLRNAAASPTERDLYTYFPYETWRANKMGAYFPELNALWRDDVLTGETGPWDRGSFIFDSAANRQRLEKELTIVAAALETARVTEIDGIPLTITPQVWDDAPLFKQAHPVYYADFYQGLAVINDVVAADRKVQEALQFLDLDEPGLAIESLYTAAAHLDTVAENVFNHNSAWILWHQSDQLPYDELLNTPPRLRQQRLATLFAELVNGDKKLFRPRNLDVEIMGLSASGDVDLIPPGWHNQRGFREEDGHIVNDGRRGTSLVRYHGTDNFENFINYALTTDLTLEEELDDGDGVGIGVRLETDWNFLPRTGYRLIIRQRTTSSSSGLIDDFFDIIFGDDDVVTTTQTLVLEKIVEGAQGQPIFEKLDSEDFGHKNYYSDDDQLHYIGEQENPYGLLQVGKPYTLFLSVTGNSITGRLRISPDRTIELTVTDDSEPHSTGTFGFYARSQALLKYSNVRFEIEGGGGGNPPFHTQRPTGDRRHLDDAMYESHRNQGTGMAQEDLIDEPLTALTTRRTAVGLVGLTAAGSEDGLFLLFDEGTPAIYTERLDKLLEKCLLATFYLRYAVIPTKLAQAYFLKGEYERAAGYLHLLYDDSGADQSEAARAIYPFLSVAPGAFTQTIGADARLIRLRLAEIYLAQAEGLFRQDTKESRYRARQLVEQVLTLHDKNGNCDCESRLGQTVVELLDRIRTDIGKDPTRDHLDVSTDFTYLAAEMFSYPPKPIDYDDIIRRHMMPDPDTHAPSNQTMVEVLKGLKASFSEAETDYQQSVHENVHFDNLLQHSQQILQEAELEAVAYINPDPVTATLEMVQYVSGRPWPGAWRPAPAQSQIDSAGRVLNWQYYPISHTFCIPPNPLKISQTQQACLLLDMLNACRNILGFTNELVPPLRFEALLRMAHNFADSAFAAERDLLNFRQVLENESYSLIQATNSLALSEADVGLEGMNVDLARGDIQLANLQAAQALDARDHFQGLVAGGLSDNEQLALDAAWASTAFSGLAAAGGILSAAATAIGIGTSATGNPTGIALAGLGIAGTLLGGAQGLASFSGALSSSASMQASFERRREEWEFNLGQNELGLDIARQNIDQAVARYEIAQRRHQIAQLGRDLAAGAVRYLEHKFLNRAMLVWLLRTSRMQYRTRLNYAITAAFMAERALAFELQNQSLRTIRFDYFDPRRDGLLGATQLQTDLETLANTKLTYLQRRLQMSKTISLSQMMPAEFQTFKQTGQLLFTTLMEWFDHDFPGHYLRLIKHVKVTVIALIPPHDGIRATLQNSGLSTVVVGPPYSTDFSAETIRRNPESVALSAPFQATGLFVLDYKDDLLLPFEGSGVGTDWIFELPQAANQFDYRTIADVLFTIEYTALNDPVYRQQIIQKVGRSISVDRAFSFRQQFADAWYDLHHPELVTDPQQPMVVKFETGREDFPPNVSNLSIEHVVLYIVPKEGTTVEIEITHLHFAEQDSAGPVSGPSTTANGIVSTRQGNANSWTAMIGHSPIGEWELALADNPQTRALFQGEQIEDILFMVTIGGTTAEWPS